MNTTKTTTALLRQIQNEKGILTIDFLFAFILVFGLIGVFFALSFTLSVVEVTQYMTFASARNYFAGHLTEELQKAQADAKFSSLQNHPTFRPLFSNGWFVLTDYQTGSFAQEYVDTTPQYNTFWGSVVNFEAKMLEIKIPLFGSTTNSDDGNTSGFRTRISSFLAREPSAQECMNFTRQRYNAFVNKFGDGNKGTNAYVAIDDNGC